MMITGPGTIPSWVPDVLFDADPIVWVQHLFGLGHPLPFRVLDLLAATWGVLFTIGLALWLWGRDDAYALAAIMALEVLVNLALNHLFSVPRPSAPEIVKYERIGLGSFPSGHVFTITVLWGLLWARRRVPLWLAAAVVAGVAVGRLYLGVHYLADVLGGALLGAALVWAFRRAWPAVRDWLGGRSHPFFLGAGGLLVGAALLDLTLFSSDNPFRWNAAGMVVGGVPALLAEARFVRYRPAPADARRTAAKIGLGLLGLLPLLLAERLTGEDALRLGAALIFLGTLWALLALPALLRRWGWSTPA
jgi:membrane-associated phospholipid phosphatase